eukprot:g4370.t1
MGRKTKRKFVDKKKCSTYHVVHRSQADPDFENEEVSNVVLAPSNRNAEIAMMRALEVEKSVSSKKGSPCVSASTSTAILGDTLNSEGFETESGYDYSKHLRTVGGGTFIGADGKIKNSNADIFAMKRPTLPSTVFGTEDSERHRKALEAVALDGSKLPSDIRDALEGDFNEIEEGGFEELLDDFCIEASKVPEVPEEVPFDFDAHCAALIANARKRGHQHDGILASRPDMDEDADDSEWEFTSEDEEDFPPELVETNNAPKRFIDEAFDVAIRGYDDSELGELESDEEMQGNLDIDGERMNELFDEFLGEHGEEISRFHAVPVVGGVDLAREPGKNVRDGDTLSSAASVTSKSSKKKPSKAKIIRELLEQNALKDGREWDEEAVEDDDFDVASYFPAREEPQFDAETIVSTYSNLENHPAKIGMNSVRSKIKLSKKTGLPCGILTNRKMVEKSLDKLDLVIEEGEAEDESDEEFPEEFETLAITHKRVKGETREEKRARKNAVKLERRQRRAMKKSNTLAFKEEEKKIKRTNVGKRGRRCFKY